MANPEYNKKWYDEKIREASLREINDKMMRTNERTISRSSEIKPQNGLPHAMGSSKRRLFCSILAKPYGTATVNTMVVGILVGELDKHIGAEDWGMGKDTHKRKYTTYCIGLSLGAHLCGFIGKSHKMVNIRML